MQLALRANLLSAFIPARRRIGYDRARSKEGHSLVVNERIGPGGHHVLDAFAQFLLPLHRDLIQRCLRLRLLESRLIRSRINCEKQIPFLYIGPILKMARDDLSADLRLDLDSLDYASAVRDLSKAAVKPPFPDTAYYLGFAYFKRGDLPNAEKWLTEAAHANPPPGATPAVSVAPEVAGLRLVVGGLVEYGKANVEDSVSAFSTTPTQKPARS